MASIDKLSILTSDKPIVYGDKLLVYFVFDGEKEPDILTCRYAAEREEIIRWLKLAKVDRRIRIVIVWPGEWRSEAFRCNPNTALNWFHENGYC